MRELSVVYNTYWDKRFFCRDRVERERNAAITRRAAGREIKAPEKYDPSEENKKSRSAAADLKAVQVSR
jgi:hypothetical protein